MKKFVFTLQSVLKYKETVEKKQKADLAAVMAVLAQLYAQDKALDEAFARTAQSLDRALQGRMNLSEELPRHDAYFLFIREEKAILRKKIEAAEEAKRRCQKALMQTMNEIKTLEKLKAEQLAAYWDEVRAEEAKDLGDMVSFRAISGEE
jgi:hypothetical protein